MATQTFPYADIGAASFEQMDNYLNTNLLAGIDPEFDLDATYGFPLANSTSFAQFSVVGLDANGKVALATVPTATTPIAPIGIIAHAVSLGATGSANAVIWYKGCFNQDALVWDTSFTTDAEKQAAFFGAKTPTNIIVRKRAAQGGDFGVN